MDNEEVQGQDQGRSSNYPDPPFLQRSISAPAMSKKIVEYGGMLNHPSRQNPRLPLDPNNKQRNDEDQDLFMSLNIMAGSNPMDLIQADFPSTPSSVFTNTHIPLMGESVKEGKEHHVPSSPSKSVSDQDHALDNATSSFQNLNVNHSNNNSVAGSGGSNNDDNNDSVKQKDNNFTSLLGNNPANIVGNGLNPNAPSISNLLLPGAAANTSTQGQTQSQSQQVSSASYSGPSNTQQSNQSNQSNQYYPNNYNQGHNQQQMQGMRQQPVYYVQQAVYLDQNGQPIYYRPAGNVNVTQDGFIYQNPSPDGGSNGGATMLVNNDGTMSMAAPGSFMQYGNQMNNTAMVNIDGSMQMYVNGPPGLQQGVVNNVGLSAVNASALNLNNVDNSRVPGATRMVYNAPGQYIPASVGSVPQMAVQMQNGNTRPTINNNGQSTAPYDNNGNMNNANQISSNITASNNMGNVTVNGMSSLLPRAQINGQDGISGNVVNDSNVYVVGPRVGNHNEIDSHGVNVNMGVVNGVVGMNMQGIHNNGIQGRMNDIGNVTLQNNMVMNDGYSNNHNRNHDNRGANGHNENYRNDNRGGGHRNNDRDNRNNRHGNHNHNHSNNNGSNPVRDPLVDEFRVTYGKGRTWGLMDLSGHVVAFCQDQHGSRFIQQRLEVCSDEDKQAVFDEIITAAQSLMTDVFGNYVLQKLFEYGTADQCETLALLLKGQSVNLAMQMYGCRVVQKALEYVNTPRLIDLVSEFENPKLLLSCVHDSNGNHVIQKCIEIVSKVAKEAQTTAESERLSSKIQFIINAFRGNVKKLSSHPYGCRVVQRILEHCSNDQKAIVLEELRQCCTELVQDCYGNYVIQFVMQHGWEPDRAVLIREVQSNLLDFSQHKFASNVVEKCLQYANKKDRDEMIWKIINFTFDSKSPVDSKGHCVLESMVRDPYANYVVQKVIDVSDDRQRAAIMRYVKENITQLRRYTYGKHIIVRLEKITNEKF